MGRQEVWRLEEELDMDDVRHRFYLTYSTNLTKEALEGFGDFRIGINVNGTVKWADGSLWLAKEETILAGHVWGTKLSSTTLRNGNECGGEERMVWRISRYPSPVQIMLLTFQGSKPYMDMWFRFKPWTGFLEFNYFRLCTTSLGKTTAVCEWVQLRRS